MLGRGAFNRSQQLLFNHHGSDDRAFRRDAQQRVGNDFLVRNGVLVSV